MDTYECRFFWDKELPKCNPCTGAVKSIMICSAGTSKEYIDLFLSIAAAITEKKYDTVWFGEMIYTRISEDKNNNQ